MDTSPATTTAILTAYYGHFNDGNREALLALLTDDVAHDINQGGREVGRAAFRDFLNRMDRCYRERLTDIRISVSADGRHGAAEYVVHGTYLVADEGLPPAHGQTYVLPGGAFFALQGDRIARVTNCYNLNDWLRQVGAPVPA